MEEKTVDITLYPEGAQYLAENLQLPVPKENMPARVGMVVGLIGLLVRQ
ncbi:MAG: hypothetical protein IJT62_04415 [Oscillospiraceae bacterium]|nr:hypothetical protein [Oscillospiraceae bacterium]